jgi:hypothetical protein
MKTTTALFSVLTTVFTPTLTAPVAAPVAAPWQVTNYTEGCSPGGCVYNFNIAWRGSPTNEPAFSTTCQGTNVAGPGNYQPCDDANIVSNAISGDLNETVFVSHKWVDENGNRYNVSGSVTLDTPLPESFQIMKGEILRSPN